MEFGLEDSDDDINENLKMVKLIFAAYILRLKSVKMVMRIYLLN